MAVISPVWTIAALPWTESVYSTGKSPKTLAPAWHLVTITWSNLNSGTADTAVAAPAGYLTDLCVQFAGTVTSLALHGSNDGSNYVALKDSQGVAISAIAATAISQIQGHTLYIKPVITTGTAVNVILCGRLPLS